MLAVKETTRRGPSVIRCGLFRLELRQPALICDRIKPNLNSGFLTVKRPQGCAPLQELAKCRCSANPWKSLPARARRRFRQGTFAIVQSRLVCSVARDVALRLQGDNERVFSPRLRHGCSQFLISKAVWELRREAVSGFSKVEH